MTDGPPAETIGRSGGFRERIIAPVTNRALLRRIVALFAPHRGAIAITIALVVLAAAIGVFPPLLIRQTFDAGLFPPSGDPDMALVVSLVGLMIALWILVAVIGVAQTHLTASVGNAVVGRLRIQLFGTLQRMDLAFFTGTKTGIIQSRLQNDVGGVTGVLTSTIASVVGNSVIVVASLVAMLILSWQLTMLAIILLPLLVVVQGSVGRVRARIAREAQESLSEMTAMTQESLSVSGILLSKTFGQRDAVGRAYATESLEQVGLQVRLQTSGQWFIATVTVILAVVPAVVYLVAAWLITGGVEVTAGTIVAFTTVLARLMAPLMGLLRVAIDLRTSSALFTRIFEYLDLRPAITDRPDAIDVPVAELGRVQFEGVGFRYPGSSDDSRSTISNVSFDIRPGQFVAFVGPSGAGKTTIAYLIARLQDATSGRVLVGGIDVRLLRLDSLMAGIGIVSQESTLFHASVRENLLFADPSASQGQIEAAARAANIHDTVMSFPGGYDTIVGERGYRLSGGEKQRIAIARVLLKDPPVLLLDEATSSLDSISERTVQTALDAAARGRTTIAVAHRLSTVIGADVIFVVDRGQIVERGTHSELVAIGGLYSSLYQEQRAVE